VTAREPSSPLQLGKLIVVLLRLLLLLLLLLLQACTVDRGAAAVAARDSQQSAAAWEAGRGAHCAAAAAGNAAQHRAGVCRDPEGLEALLYGEQHVRIWCLTQRFVTLGTMQTFTRPGGCAPSAKSTDAGLVWAVAKKTVQTWDVISKSMQNSEGLTAVLYGEQNIRVWF
jgi:hypothetical protein